MSGMLGEVMMLVMVGVVMVHIGFNTARASKWNIGSLLFAAVLVAGGFCGVFVGVDTQVKHDVEVFLTAMEK